MNPLDKFEEQYQKGKPQQDLNKNVELEIKANSFASPVFPKPGVLKFGDRGVEFVSDNGFGYIQIPWASIEKVAADVHGKYVRAIEISTDETSPLNFVISNGVEALRIIRDHIGREKIVSAPQNFKATGQKLKNKVQGVFKRKK